MKNFGATTIGSSIHAAVGGMTRVRLVRSLITAIAFAQISACGALSPQPPQSFLESRIASADVKSHVRVEHLALYYSGSGGETKWRDVGDGRYALDITDQDPLTNAPRAINFLFETSQATRAAPEVTAIITQAALNGERIAPADIYATYQLIAQATHPALRSVDQRSPASANHAATLPLACYDGTGTRQLEGYTLASLDAAYRDGEHWVRYERPDATLADGTPFFHIGYESTPDAEQHTEFAADEENGMLVLLSREEYDDAGEMTASRRAPYICGAVTEFLQARAPVSPQAATQSAVPGVEIGTNYKTARRALLVRLFHPLHFPRGADAGCLSDEICRAFPEVEGCSGMGMNPCRIAWLAPDGAILVGVVSGEVPDELSLDALVYANAEDSQTVRDETGGH